MPTRICLTPRCPNPATYRGRCRTCSRSRERATHQNKGFYGLKRWKILRRHILFTEPLCRICGRIATDVDHIIPIAQGGNPWATSNLQPLCAPCHSRKTRHEQTASATSATTTAKPACAAHPSKATPHNPAKANAPSALI